jgi:hypothetical protein
VTCTYRPDESYPPMTFTEVTVALDDVPDFDWRRLPERDQRLWRSDMKRVRNGARPKFTILRGPRLAAVYEFSGQGDDRA